MQTALYANDPTQTVDSTILEFSRLRKQQGQMRKIRGYSRKNSLVQEAFDISREQETKLDR